MQACSKTASWPPLDNGSNKFLCAAISNITLGFIAHAPTPLYVLKKVVAVYVPDNLGARIYNFHVPVLQSISTELFLLTITDCCRKLYNICSWSIKARLLPFFCFPNGAQQLRQIIHNRFLLRGPIYNR